MPVSELRRRWTARELRDILDEWHLQAEDADRARSGRAREPEREPTPEAEAEAVKALLY